MTLYRHCIPVKRPGPDKHLIKLMTLIPSAHLDVLFCPLLLAHMPLAQQSFPSILPG